MENTKKTIFKIDEFEKQFDYEICLSQIRFYNLKKGDFLAITLIFQKKENFQSNDPSTFIFTNPKRFGIENYEDLDDVKETKLYFERNDEVINEFVSIYNNNILKGLIINTSYGKFLEIGKKEQNDKLETIYFHSPNFFNELNIEYNNKKITYITAKSIKKNIGKEEDKKIELNDISEDYQFPEFVFPIIKSDIIGKFNDNTEFIDDIQKFSLVQDMKDNRVNVTEISIWSNGNKITRFDTKYFNSITGKLNNSLHISEQFNPNNKHDILELDNNDFICEIIVGLNNTELKNLCFITLKGKKLEVNNGECKTYIKFKEDKGGKLLRLLGIIIGKGLTIDTIQFYYEIIKLK